MEQRKCADIYDPKYCPPENGRWYGRSRTGTNSFAQFLARVRHTKQGRAHLDRHHKNWEKQVK